MTIPILWLLAAGATSTVTVTLDQALESSRAQHPAVRRAGATIQAARSRVDANRAPLFPQVTARASYQRTWERTAGGFNFFSAGAGVDQLIWDFGRTTKSLEASEAAADASEDDRRSTLLSLELEVRATYFTARAQKALVEVAKQSLANQLKHYAQIEGFVEVGTRPSIDLVQTRTDVANARVQLTNAESDYTATKAALNRAMGVERSTDYDVADETIGAIEGEESTIDVLLEEAIGARPELAAQRDRLRAQELVIAALRGNYWPSIGASAGVQDTGRQLDELEWNVNAGVSLIWPIYSGGETGARVAEAEANLLELRADVEDLRQEVRLELEQVRAVLRGAKEALLAADEAQKSARVRLELAEGRYETGVGNIIELGDAQLALTSAEAQRVQADFNLAAGRARLLKALGRM
jgi:outer membrane protein